MKIARTLFPLALAFALVGRRRQRRCRCGSLPESQLDAAPDGDIVQPAGLQPPRAVRSRTVDGPIVVRMKDVPTGDPRALPGVLRGHEQGRPQAPDRPTSSSAIRRGPRRRLRSRSGRAPRTRVDRRCARRSRRVRRNFAAQAASGWIPPDPVLAVGPKYMLEVVNSGFTVYSKDGGLERSYTDLQTFFDPILDAIPCAAGRLFRLRPARPLHALAQQVRARGAGARRHESAQLHRLRHLPDDRPARRLVAVLHLRHLEHRRRLDRLLGNERRSAWGLYFTGNNFYWTGGFKYAIEISLRPDVFSRHLERRLGSSGTCAGTSRATPRRSTPAGGSDPRLPGRRGDLLRQHLQLERQQGEHPRS